MCEEPIAPENEDITEGKEPAPPVNVPITKGD